MLRLRVLGPLLLGVLALAVPTALADLAGEKEGVDARIEQLRAEIEEAKRHETVLTSDIAAASERIRIVEGEVDLLAGKVAALELELARHRARLAELRERYREQTRRLTLLEDAERTAVRRLEERLVDLYENEPPDGIEVLLLSRSLNDLISQLEYLDQIAREDRRIAEAVEQARAAVAAARHQTEATRAREAEVTATLAARTAERREALERLVARRNQLVSAQADREALLTAVRESRHEAAEDLEVLERESAELAARIRAAQSRSTAAPAVSSSGFLWPVSGPITSPFGMRWGRLHAGIDIGAAFGTTISVAAGGTVIYAGWLGGYGNLVVVDHGGGLATAYAHQQAIYVGVGQSVGRGEALGEVGSTGNSTGPHLHFEVRVNGSPVDPLGYL